MKNYFGQLFVFRKFAGKCPRCSSFLEKLQTLLLASFYKRILLQSSLRIFPIHFKQSKWNKLSLPSGRSQKNLHHDVHFWNSYRCCCSQLFKKEELHYSQLEEILQKLWNKINKKVVSAVSTFQRKCQYKQIHFCRSCWVLHATFWLEKNSTVVNSKVFSTLFQKLWNKANKKAASAFRTFLEKCLRSSLFLEKLQTFASNLNPNQLHCSNLQGVL